MQEFSSSSVEHVLSLVQSALLRTGWRREWDLNPRGPKAHRISAPGCRFSNPTPYLARRSRRSMSVALKLYITRLRIWDVFPGVIATLTGLGLSMLFSAIGQRTFSACLDLFGRSLVLSGFSE